jgi:hypothetical protein
VKWIRLQSQCRSGLPIIVRLASEQPGGSLRLLFARLCFATSGFSVSNTTFQPMLSGARMLMLTVARAGARRRLCAEDGMSPLNLPVAKAFGSESEYIGGAFLIGSGIMLTFSEP